MMNLFLTPTVTTLETFKKSLYNRIKLFILLGILGLCTMIAGLLPQFTNLIVLEDYLSGFLTGFGMTLLIASIIFTLRTLKIIRDEQKLKEERLKFQDERNIFIANQSLKVASLVMLICLYIAMIASAFINRHMLYCFLIPAFIFLGSYIIAILYFKKRY
ncbi:MAG: hypothetical protein E7231_08930 [Cellulosilyticum sp.]|nr:hypothetical protein [Cellulosilyticum sp.]